MASAERQSRQKRERQIQNRRRRGLISGVLRRTLKHADLVAQGQVLELHGGTRTQDRRQNCKECRKKNKHQREL